jgi:hypothetical protein
MTGATPPRDAAGNAIPYVEPAGSLASVHRWYAYRADPVSGWRFVGGFDSESAAPQSGSRRHRLRTKFSSMRYVVECTVYFRSASP